MQIARRSALLIAIGVLLISTMGLKFGESGGDIGSDDGRRRGFCILPVGFIADEVTGDCNWEKRNDIEWIIEPTINGNEFIASGKIKEDSSTISWQASDAMRSGLYYSPFQIYADCNSSPAGAILPPISGRGTWTDLDPGDVVAAEWSADGTSFLIRTPVPSAWDALENLELHVHSGSSSVTSVPLSVAKINRE